MLYLVKLRLKEMLRCFLFNGKLDVGRYDVLLLVE
jgi:hypothetical protein